MKCDICQINDAVVFLQEVRGNQKKELHLCLECANKKGIPTPMPGEKFNPEKISLEKIYRKDILQLGIQKNIGKRNVKGEQ